MEFKSVNTTFCGQTIGNWRAGSCAPKTCRLTAESSAEGRFFKQRVVQYIQHGNPVVQNQRRPVPGPNKKYPSPLIRNYPPPPSFYHHIYTLLFVQ